MNLEFPGELSGFLDLGVRVQAELRGVKQQIVLADYGWYPYESLSALPILADLLGPMYSEVAEACRARPAADIGCADGDLAVLLARLGLDVDAIDHRESNFNQMRGAEMLCRMPGLSIHVHDVDLDQRFALPRRDYGLVLFLGTLYHLKNPFYVLETLAGASDWCVVSTRIAQVTPVRRTRIEAEPVAYLLGAREANNDPTNFWIFSPEGLLRILDRTGWIPVSQKRVGCAADSDPVSGEADERMYVLLKSRTRHPELHVHRLEGWHAAEQEQWQWTGKRFALQVALPASEPAREFALRFVAPEAVLESAGRLRLECRIGEFAAGSITCETAGPIEFRGRLPESAGPGSVLRLEFFLESSYVPPGDARELGVIVPLLDAAHRNTERVPFRIS